MNWRELLDKSAEVMWGAPLPAAVAPVAADHPDAKLIAICRRFEALEAGYRREIEASADGADPPDGYDETLRAIAVVPATTPDGIRAKARAVYAFYTPDPPEYESVATDAMWSLICDAAGLS